MQTPTAVLLAALALAPLPVRGECTADLDGDGADDLALLVEAPEGRELVVLLRRGQGWLALTLAPAARQAALSCELGEEVWETSPGRGKRLRRVHPAPGAYLELSGPEGAARAYFWDGATFSEVWTAD